MTVVHGAAYHPAAFSGTQKTCDGSVGTYPAGRNEPHHFVNLIKKR